jgi:flagellar protein FlbD
VIHLTRLNSHALTVNSDLIKFIENAPDTMLTLNNGEKIVVRESADEVIKKVIEFRRAVLVGLISAGADPNSALAASKPAEEDHHLNHSIEDHSRG